MESIRLDWFKKTFIVYMSCLLCVSMCLSGCGSDALMSLDDSKSTVAYNGNAKTLASDQQQQLMTLVEKMTKDNQAMLTINMPSPQAQTSSYERALWQSRATNLKQFLRMQGLSSNQIQFKECLSCTTMLVG